MIILQHALRPQAAPVIQVCTPTRRPLRSSGLPMPPLKGSQREYRVRRTPMTGRMLRRSGFQPWGQKATYALPQFRED
jgi:hypothetical protein